MSGQTKQLHDPDFVFRQDVRRHGEFGDVWRNPRVLAEVRAKPLALGDRGLGAVELRHDLPRQPVLGFARIAGQELPDLRRGKVRQKLEPHLHALVRDGHGLAEFLARTFADADRVAQALRHFVAGAVGPDQQRRNHAYLRRLALFALKLATGHQIEFLVGAAEFDVSAHLNRVPTLHNRIHQFVQSHGLIVLQALLEGIALDHLGNGEAAHQAQGLVESHRLEPIAVADDFQPVGVFVQDQRSLREVRLEVGFDLRVGKHRAGFVLPRRIADLGRAVADDEHRLVP